MIAVKYFDTGTGKWTDLTGQTGSSLAIDASGWGVKDPSAFISWGDISGDLSGQTDLKNALDAKVNKSFASYVIKANNTASTADAADHNFRYITLSSYSETISWNGAAAPSGSEDHTYTMLRIGNMCTVTISLSYSDEGSGNTRVNMPLSADMPTPIAPNGYDIANGILYVGSGHMSTDADNNDNIVKAYLKKNSANDDYEFMISTATAGNYKYAQLTITYFTE